LDKKIFPETSGIFDVTCVRHAMHYFEHSILIGKAARQIESYVSFFPLNRRGFDYCIEKNVTTICHFPADMFKSRRRGVTSIFLEVLATTPTCPYGIKRDTISISIALLRQFDFLPFLSCPVSDDGLRILDKLGFSPVRSPGLNELYIRPPKERSPKTTR
jgi:hypothetical protein